jgi:hypothetical protein
LGEYIGSTALVYDTVKKITGIVGWISTAFTFLVFQSQRFEFVDQGEEEKETSLSFDTPTILQKNEGYRGMEGHFLCTQLILDACE